jgi:pyruvate kinase
VEKKLRTKGIGILRDNFIKSEWRNMNTKQILVTLGPSSLNYEIIKEIEKEDIYLFRINLSHTAIADLEKIINKIRQATDVPICLDSEGAQLRTQKMEGGEVSFQLGDVVKVHFDEIIGDSKNISFTPLRIAEEFVVGDEIKIDFDSACIRIIEKNRTLFLAEVISGGKVGTNKAANVVGRHLNLEPITSKDKQAITIGKEMGIHNFALSFAGSSEDVNMFREITGRESTIISKIESMKGLLNLENVLEESDEILIDRGDLSREVPLVKIPFLQRRITAFACAKGVPVYVATNLLESMLLSAEPNRSEVNDVVSSLGMGASGLVLAAETAIGKFPVEAARITRKLINQFEKWTPNSSVEDVLRN